MYTPCAERQHCSVRPAVVRLQGFSIINADPYRVPAVSSEGVCLVSHARSCIAWSNALLCTYLTVVAAAVCPPAELQAFDGLSAPVVVNSRLAMLGFAIAVAPELFQGKDVCLEQIGAYPLLTVATFVAVAVASWIPFLRGQSFNVKSGAFTPAVGFDVHWHIGVKTA